MPGKARAPRRAAAAPLPDAPDELRAVFGTRFWRDFVASWHVHGPSVLERLALHEPAAYLSAALKLIPQLLELSGRGGGPVVVRWLGEGEDNGP